MMQPTRGRDASSIGWRVNLRLHLLFVKSGAKSIGNFHICWIQTQTVLIASHSPSCLG